MHGPTRPTTNLTRLAALDLIRGIAVLGILAVNIAGFAGPIASTTSPNLPVPGSTADEIWFAFVLLVFEGKMRGLLTLLFGASLVLFVERADAAGENGEQLQLRRLGWLLLIGYLHWLLWWGDILFTYALAGMAALALREAPPRALAGVGVAALLGWSLFMSTAGLGPALLEEQVFLGRASPAGMAEWHESRATAARNTAHELAGYREAMLAQAANKLVGEPGEPLRAALANAGETLPLMALGMALYGTGFFAGRWPRRKLQVMAAIGLGGGGTLTLGFIGWAWVRHFPPEAMIQALAFWLGPAHLLLTLGYAAGLVLLTPALAARVPGRWLSCVGRMALTCYLGTSLLMTALFYGWGLGLVGRVPQHWHWPFVLGGWAAMLAASRIWLAKWDHGPLEWAWRRLTWWRIMAR